MKNTQLEVTLAFRK